MMATLSAVPLSLSTLPRPSHSLRSTMCRKRTAPLIWRWRWRVLLRIVALAPPAACGAIIKVNGDGGGCVRTNERGEVVRGIDCDATVRAKPTYIVCKDGESAEEGHCVETDDIGRIVRPIPVFDEYDDDDDDEEKWLWEQDDDEYDEDSSDDDYDDDEEEEDSGDGEDNDGASIPSLTDEQILADAIKGIGHVVLKAGAEEGQETEPCRDRRRGCREWAEDRECLENPEYMLEKCPRSCLVCSRKDRFTIDFGVEQQIDVRDEDDDDDDDDESVVHPDEITDVIERTLKYMVEEVFVDDKYVTLRRDCRNLDPKCSFYAARGECDDDDDQENVDWMHENCAPACQACVKVAYQHWCGLKPDAVDAMKAGDLNVMFERIVSEYPDYNPTVLSRPAPRTKEEDLADGDGPWVVTLENFLSDEECDLLIAQGHELGFKRSKLARSTELNDVGISTDVEGSSRTSSQAWCQASCEDHPTVKRILKRMVEMTGIPEVNSEHLQLLKYDVGQYYHSHHDTSPDHIRVSCGYRVVTFFIYLNTVEEGGETQFTTLGLDVKPRKGMALLWPSVSNDDLNKVDDRTYHEALPVKKGVKYGVNAWFHLRNFKDVVDCFH